jgi:hypothetical protein
MWVPSTEAEIEAAISANELRETATFDAKACLPPPGRNKDLAKDICAMTVDGGVLLYGVGGDDPTRPDTLIPFHLAGAAERIDQVAQTGIAEAPSIEIRDIDSERTKSAGYLAVVVPPSPRAPHMLILDGDNRYWGRGATGNRRLSEGEVARLYDRRERWEIDRGEMLQDALDAIPFAAGDLAAICLFAHPVAGVRDVLGAAAGGGDVTGLVGGLRDVAQANDPYPDQGDVSISSSPSQVRRRGAAAWMIDAGFPGDDEYAAQLDVSREGLLRYWSKPLAYEDQARFVVRERSVTRDAGQFMAVAGHLYDRSGYVGPVDVGVAVVGIDQAYGSSAGMRQQVYGAADYQATERVTMQELRGDHRGVVLRLLEPLYDVISRPGYDPFNDG